MACTLSKPINSTTKDAYTADFSPATMVSDTTVGFSFVLAPSKELSQRGLHKIPSHILTLKFMVAYRRTLERAENVLRLFLVGHPLVPVYDPINYRYPRLKGRTEQLRSHVQVRYNLATRRIFVRWTSPHAKWVSRQSPDFNIKIKRARSVGTSLNWVKMLKPAAKKMLRAIWMQELHKQGLHPSRLPISVHDALFPEN